jgi:hypothetical protein
MVFFLPHEKTGISSASLATSLMIEKVHPGVPQSAQGLRLPAGQQDLFFLLESYN